MKRSEEQILARREYIKALVNNSKNPSRTVKRLSKLLFISESTIWKDVRAGKMKY